MRCTHPVWIRRKDSYGRYLRSNNGGFAWQEVPCGKCDACRLEKTKAWAVRLMLESLDHDDNCFVTLTYDNDHVPMTMDVKGDQKLRLTLFKRDCQLFFKRLRKKLKQLGRSPILYYLAGEYGDHTFRPHYHFIGFGLSEFDQELIQEVWQKGHVDVGDVTMKSCNYVAGYIQKKLYGDVADNVYGFRQFPFSLMSKGLGKSYFLQHKDELMDKEYILFHRSKVRVPRYFWKLMLKDECISELEYRALQRKWQEEGEKAKRVKYARFGVTDPRLIEEFEERARRAREHNLAIIKSFKERDLDER